MERRYRCVIIAIRSESTYKKYNGGKGGESMDYEKLGLITEEEMDMFSKAESDEVMADTDTLKSAAAGAAAGGGAAAGSAGGAAAAHM